MTAKPDRAAVGAPETDPRKIVGPPGKRNFEASIFNSPSDNPPRRDRRITKVGALADLTPLKGAGTVMVDLDGHAMPPGFVDAHGHAVFGGLQALSANLLAPPDGAVTDIDGLLKTLKT